MVIDIILIIVFCIALLYGWRKGAIVQLLQLIGLYVAILFAPDYASEIGEVFTQDQGLAYIIGFILIIIGAWLFIWIIAPLFRKILFFEALRQIDSLLGMVFAFLATVVIISVLCSVFVTANIGDMRADKILELGAMGLNQEQIEDYAEKLESRDKSLREYFEPKYIAYETLDESKLFYRLAAFGEAICPGLEQMQEEMVKWSINVKSKYESIY